VSLERGLAGTPIQLDASRVEIDVV